MSLFLRTGPAAARRLSRRTASEKCFGSCFEANFLHHRCSSAVLSLKSDRQIRTRSCLWSRSRSYSSFSKTRPIRIGCASGFWGDTATSVPQLIHGGKLDFLVFDYLSEITMSLLTAAKAKMPNMGYAPDFVQLALAPFINDIHRKGIRVVSNAGGVNPLSCAEAIREVVKKAGLDLKVAVVTGDDLMPHRNGITEVKMADGGDRQPLPKTLHSMNAYLGATPIKRCLDHGADIVITGRCVDSAVTLGPLMHSFGWKTDEYDLLAAGSLAGHLIECGAQSTGGIFTDWYQVPDWDNMGFPVVEVSSDGTFLLSKPPRTGGLVSFGSVAEQLVYEIGDPRRYLLPDVTCDFSQVIIKEKPGVDGGSVTVTGAKGFSPSQDYKVCATYMDGFRATAVCPVGGPRAAEKARRTADSIVKRMKHIFKQLQLEDFNSVHVQVLGAEDTYGPHARSKGCREAVLWLSVHHTQKKALEMFSREVAPAGTGMAPGLTGIVGGRPRVSPVLKPFFFLHPKSETKVDVHVNGELVESVSEVGPDTAVDEAPPTSAEDVPDTDLPSGPHSYRLEDLAYTRSGDKGDTANIGVVARHPLFYPYLKKHLTSSVVEEYFSHVIQPGVREAVTRYTLPGIHGLNFVLRSSLGGGGVASLRSDPQGKAYGQMLLDLKLRGLPDLKSLVD
ncbi:uncharacterized protein LOC103389552 [Cynoglossus semilaevis]|uniref:Si:ch73-132f6.5 n=1 Tax=Cynoglossus semilaevis TaxID=244447 RepID=A0A3P8V219_CYNSE|nr:uncharacterized protein LOC103389552 [Cynoglossus semilaevis]